MYSLIVSARVWPELQVVATACDGPSAFQAIRTHRPTLAFLDIRMPGMSGLQVAGAVGEQTLVVIVSAYDHYARSAFETGVVDHVLKPVELPRLLTVVRRLQERMSVVRIDENMEVILKDRPERIKVSSQYQALFRQM